MSDMAMTAQISATGSTRNRMCSYRYTPETATGVETAPIPWLVQPMSSAIRSRSWENSPSSIWYRCPFTV